MSVDSIANLASSLASARTDQAVGIAVLKKALDAESATANALLDSMPPVESTSNLPSNLGQNINTTA